MIRFILVIYLLLRFTKALDLAVVMVMVLNLFPLQILCFRVATDISTFFAFSIFLFGSTLRIPKASYSCLGQFSHCNLGGLKGQKRI